MTVNDAKLEFAPGLARRSSTTELILHHAAADGPVELIHDFHRSRGWYGIGYHYYVRKDGSLWRGRPEETVGAHTAGHNGRAIGICFEGNFETEEMAAPQLAAGRELIADILARYPGISVSGHRDMDATACPGKNFPAELFSVEPAEREDEADAFIARLTDAQAYAILEKAQRHAATLPLPQWAEEEYEKARAAGITDGRRPMALVPRYQAALMALRKN